MMENVGDLSNKLVVLKDNQYYVYVGITLDKNNVDKIKKIYEDMGYQIYVQEIELDSEEFISNVSQFDLLVAEADSTDDILSVEEVVLANYEQIFGTGIQ